VTLRFNRADHRTAAGKRIRVQAVPQGSGELIDDILSGARKAHLTSPASAAFLKLGNARSRARTGKDLIGESRNLVLSPVVIAMWKPMAEALGWGTRPVGWSDILTLAKDPAGWASRGHPEWGAFKLGHTHPEYSNSGLISLLAEGYAGAGKVAGLSLEDVRQPRTASYVAGIESAIVHYGSSTGFFGKRMFEGGPGYLSAAVLYENMVTESYDPQYHLPFPVVAVYPREGTFWSDHPVGIVWWTPGNGAGGLSTPSRAGRSSSTPWSRSRGSSWPPWKRSARASSAPPGSREPETSRSRAPATPSIA
jgi:Ca-activated chloride channel family protein